MTELYRVSQERLEHHFARTQGSRQSRPFFSPGAIGAKNANWGTSFGGEKSFSDRVVYADDQIEKKQDDATRSSFLRSDSVFSDNGLLGLAEFAFKIHHRLWVGFTEGDLPAWESIHREVHEGFLRMDLEAQAMEYPKDLIKSAQYVLCSYLDEVLSSKEWEQQRGLRRQDTFLSHYFQETWGGERVFQIRHYCLEDIRVRIDVFELIYLCLCFGFKGKYAIQEEGEAQLAKLKQESYHVMRDYKDYGLDLSEGVFVEDKDQGRYDAIYTKLKAPISLKNWLLWVGGIVMVGYFGMSVMLWRLSEPVHENLSNLVHIFQGADIHEGY